VDGQRFRYVLLVHPSVAVAKLRADGKIDPHWWDTYRARQIQTKETSYGERLAMGPLDRTSDSTMRTVASSAPARQPTASVMAPQPAGEEATRAPGIGGDGVQIGPRLYWRW
jgi:hypothetical protein